MGANGAVASRAELLEEIERSQRFLLATHENPDGDALGSLAGMQLVLTALGKDSRRLMAPDEFPLPVRVPFLQVENLVTEPPADLEERTIVFLDCGNIDRNPADSLKREGAHILNVDHHHDNTHFGTVNHVVPEASCTAEVIWDLMDGLGVRPTQAIAEALYVGLVTDTGKFMYENTGPRAHEMAAELIEAGVDVHAIYRRLFEGVPQGKLELLARGLANVERFDGGLLSVTHLTRDDYAATDADESFSEGVVDHLRALQGTAMAGLVRDLLRRPAEPRGARSRCARPTTASTSRRSRARRAAAATAGPPASRPTMEFPELVEFLRAASPSSRPEHRWGHPVRQAGGDHVPRRRGRRAQAAGPRPQGRPCRHAGSVRDRAAARAGGARDPRAALPDGAPEALRDRRAPGLDLDHRRPRRRARPGPDAAEPPRCRPGASSSARPRTRRSRSAAGGPTSSPGAGRRSSWPSARSRSRASSALAASGTARRSRSSAPRAPTCASLISDLGDAYCLELRRTAIGPSTSPTPTRSASCRSPTRSIPARGRGSRARTPAAPRTAWRWPATRTAPCGCSTTTA